ncbi:MAG: hypothetical protein ABJC04_08940, partial [Verrucomicrobiota bacterium]
VRREGRQGLLRSRVESTTPKVEKAEGASTEEMKERPRTQSRAKRDERKVITSEKTPGRPERKPRAKAGKE